MYALKAVKTYKDHLAPKKLPKMLKNYEKKLLGNLFLLECPYKGMYLNGMCSGSLSV